MNNAVAEAFVRLRPDAKGFEGEASSSIGGALKKVAGIATAAFAGVKIAKFLGGAIDEAREAEKVMAQTAQVIKTTGGAAGVSAADVDKLASSISKMTGIDDEAIAGAENLLLTFTNIKNVGPDKIFDQATQAAVDMAAALGGDAAGQSIALGKALNDPIKGVTALSRVGVSFTQQQKDQIKAMVEAGDVAGAQKIILAELGKEFGGQAAAQATAADKAKVAWGNFQEEIGARLLPMVDKLATFFTERALPAVDALFGYLARVVPPIVDEVVGGIKALFAAFQAGDGDITSSGFAGVMEHIGLIARTVVDFFIANWPKAQAAAVQAFEIISSVVQEQLIPAVQKIIDVGGKVFEFIQDNWIPIAAGLGAAIVTILVPALIAWAAAQAVVAVTALSAAIPVVALYAPIVALVAGIGLLVGGLVYAYTHFETFRSIVDTVLDAIQTAWNIVWPAIQQTLEIVWEAMSLYVETAINAIKAIIDIVMGLITGDWGRVWDGIKQALQTVWDFMTGIVDLAIKAIKLVITTEIEIIKTLWSTAWGVVERLLSEAWGRIKSAVSTGIGAVVTFFTELPGKVTGAIGGLAQQLYDKGREFLDKMLSGVTDAASGLLNWFSVLPGVILGKIGDIGTKFFNLGKSIIQRLIDGIQGMLGSLLSKVGDVLGALNPLNHIPGGGILKSLNPFAAGGVTDPSKWSLVGEHGPELIGPGGPPLRVYNNKDTREIFGSASGDGGSVQTIDARMIVQGNVYGDDHLQEMFDAHQGKVLQIMKQAKRTRVGING